MSASADQCFMRKPPSCFTASIIYELFASLSTYVYLLSIPRLLNYRRFFPPSFFPSPSPFSLSFPLLFLFPISITSSPRFFLISCTRRIPLETMQFLLHSWIVIELQLFFPSFLFVFFSFDISCYERKRTNYL